jgi:hypothetical protein
MTLVGATATAQVSGQQALPGKSNYFIGRDPQQWHTRVPTYAQVPYQNVYPGIDLVYYGHQGGLEYDFVVAPGASPTPIRLAVTGPGPEAPLRVDADGNLVAGGAPGAICFHKPVVYQPAGAGRAYVEGRYVLKSAHEVGFEIAAADPTRPVVIDPTLSYSTYMGGGNYDYGYGIAVDSAGNAHVTGFTGSIDFPTANPLQPTNNGFYNAFVAKIAPLVPPSITSLTATPSILWPPNHKMVAVSLTVSATGDPVPVAESRQSAVTKRRARRTGS